MIDHERAVERCSIRPIRTGDAGWVLERHALLYLEEHGWGHEFEGIVAEVVASYFHEGASDRSAAWVAILDGMRVGSIFCIAGPESTALLRLFLVEPQARCLGVGRHLIERCVSFAAHSGYRRLELGTTDRLLAARRAYARAGFRRTWQAPEAGNLGRAETWVIDLDAGAATTPDLDR